MADELLGKYQLLSCIGKGGMAEVWKAKMKGPAGFERMLVVKRILPGLATDPAFVAMFVAEARLSARLNHPNIIQVFELGESDGDYFLSMELVEGQTLAQLIRALAKTKMIEPGMGALIVRDICRALGYAHALADENGQPLRIVHRDVTHSNVMVTREGVVKLLDFGIAKALSEGGKVTRSGTLKGKLGYLAPEMLDGAPADRYTDLFAAGVLLHELLTGRRLFKGTTESHTLELIRQLRIQPPSRFNKRVSPALDAIVLRALSRHREDRYPSAQAFEQALDGVITDLGWSNGRLATLLRELSSVPLSEDTEDAVEPEIHDYRGSARSHPRRAPLFVIPIVLIIVGSYFLLGRARHEAPPILSPAPVLPRPTVLADPAPVVVESPTPPQPMDEHTDPQPIAAKKHKPETTRPKRNVHSKSWKPIDPFAND